MGSIPNAVNGNTTREKKDSSPESRSYFKFMKRKFNFLKGNNEKKIQVDDVAEVLITIITTKKCGVECLGSLLYSFSEEKKD